MGPDSIVSALAEPLNQVGFHQQRDSGMGKGTIKSTEHTTNFSNQCTLSCSRGEINSRLKGRRWVGVGVGGVHGEK